jgi:hypothetical protein
MQGLEGCEQLWIGEPVVNAQTLFARLDQMGGA